MKRSLTLLTAFICLLLFSNVQSTHAQANVKILDQLSGQARFSSFTKAVRDANLQEMLNGWGPYTVFAPTNSAFEAMPASTRNQLNANPNLVRQLVLNHIVAGQAITSQQLWGLNNIRTASGNSISFQNQSNARTINGTARIIQYELRAANGMIYVIDKLLLPPALSGNNQGGGQTGGGGGGQAPDPNGVPPLSNVFLASPEGNPAYVPGGYMPYAEGIRRANYVDCRGMTWVLLQQQQGVSKVGADRQSNPYRGDTSCAETLSILCIKKDGRAPSSGIVDHKWTSAEIRLSAPVQGSRLTSFVEGNRICQNDLGAYWRMSTFHEAGGQYFWAHGAIPIGVRFWVMIGDQPGNPWNHTTINVPPPAPAGGVQITEPSQNPAYVSGGHMSKWDGERVARPYCKGMTWTVLHQEAGFVRVGADGKTNPYRGDTPCTESLPALCIKVNNYPAPPNRGDTMDFSRNWSGGQVKATGPVRGEWMQTIEQANQVCERVYGNGWQLAEHHDGAFHTLRGPAGWEIWAYGGLPVGTRFWVGISNQPANPWDPIQYN